MSPARDMLLLAMPRRLLQQDSSAPAVACPRAERGAGGEVQGVCCASPSTGLQQPGPWVVQFRYRCCPALYPNIMLRSSTESPSC